MPITTCSAVEIATLLKAGRGRCLKTKGRFVRALAIDAITAAVPASADEIAPLEARLAAAAVALALLAKPLIPLATMGPPVNLITAIGPDCEWLRTTESVSV
jgi:hypothetical protein